MFGLNCQRPVEASQGRSKAKKSVPVTLLALLLIVFALSQISLGLIGVSATGLVFDIQQRTHIGSGGDSENTKDPTRFELYYRFTAIDGRQYTGSVTKRFPHGIRVASDGSMEAIAVRYLSFWPHINAAQGDTSSMSSLLLLGLSALMLLFASGEVHRK